MPVVRPSKDLHAVHADVALAGSRVAGDHTGHGDETSGVFGPALENGKPVERELGVILADHFLAGPGRDRLREELAHLGQHGKHFDFVQKSLGGLDVHKLANAPGDFVERVHFERQLHAARRAELVDQDLLPGVSFDVLEIGAPGRRRSLAGRGSC